MCVCTADDCHGPTVVRQINAAVDNVTVTLTALEPEQLYHIWVTSVSAANSESTAVHLMLKTGPGGLGGGIVAAIVVAAFFTVVLMILAFSCLVRYINQSVNQSINQSWGAPTQQVTSS